MRLKGLSMTNKVGGRVGGQRERIERHGFMKREMTKTKPTKPNGMKELQDADGGLVHESFQTN